MDPVPIDHRNNSCAVILSTADKLATIFRNAAGLYNELAQTFTILSTSCAKFAEAVQAIRSWLTEGSQKELLDSAPWYQLSSTLGRAEKTISVLQDEVQSILRSRYESRSRSRVSTEWDLESLLTHGEDVKHETGALHQMLQYMQLLSIATMTPVPKADTPHDVEDSAPKCIAPAFRPSIAGGSQADTENTLDRPSPPYNLVDVRSRDTHTKWYTGESIVSQDDANLETPSATNDFHLAEADGPNISSNILSTAPPQLRTSDTGSLFNNCGQSTTKELFVTIHGNVYNLTSFHDHPSGAEVLQEVAGTDATQEFEDVDHSEEVRKLLDSFLVGQLTNATSNDLDAFTAILGLVSYRVDDLMITFDPQGSFAPSSAALLQGVPVAEVLEEPTKSIVDYLERFHCTVAQTSRKDRFKIAAIYSMGKVDNLSSNQVAMDTLRIGWCSFVLSYQQRHD